MAEVTIIVTAKMKEATAWGDYLCMWVHPME